ncbi:hypothetical protein SADUNF_Sadunf01G0079800 [Salix dunnii]|uniref:Histone deacetylase complex subunit SAP30 Sin3 binding domain-containing protein n=1 Tax=Salix dunnii TaxID=1413687 RepID=A0A835NAH8_9ROSI|nr:hypothetical protein SADUNF_Sadunf01G0079800 [Salix dunnii]
MLETELCSSRILSSFREESGDEELSVLPRHTKVVVTGNNRTKSVLVGLQGVVKKAVGLGGWHWLVLKNGSEVKLQRNALSVLEHPTGNEVDGDNDFDTSSGSDIGEHDFYRGSEFHKISKPRVRPTRPWVPSAPVKSTNRNSYRPWVPSAPVKSTNRNSYRDVQSIIHTPLPTVNLARLGTESLRRYCKEFKLPGVDSESSRERILNAAQIHFPSQRPMNEVQVVAELTRVAKRLKEKNVPSD